MRMMNNTLNLRPTEARFNITWQGQNGDLAAPVPFDATDRALKEWAREALLAGSVAGIQPVARHTDLAHFAIDRFAANVAVPYNRIFLRPVTPFG